MDLSGGLTVGSHHEAPYRWIPTEDGEDRAIVGGVVLLDSVGPGVWRRSRTRRRLASLARPLGVHWPLTPQRQSAESDSRGRRQRWS